MERSRFRGHSIYCENGEWYYSDTKTSVAGNPRNCGYCGKEDTKEGHDGCLGTLPGVMNACCGHGSIQDSYIQYWDGKIIRGGVT